jgi:hypothetical protein
MQSVAISALRSLGADLDGVLSLNGINGNGEQLPFGLECAKRFANIVQVVLHMKWPEAVAGSDFSLEQPTLS